MIVKCAWCGCSLGEKPPYGGANKEWDKMVTHGICGSCEEKYFDKKSSEKSLKG